MTAPKQEVRKIIDSLPEDTSYDEILKELAFDRMIQRGLTHLHHLLNKKYQKSLNFKL